MTNLYNSTHKNRRGGAPRGNTNALKHGFYSTRFKTIDTKELAAYEFRGLTEEINLVRLGIARVCDFYGEIEDKSEATAFLLLICTASSTLNRLVRTQAALKLDQADISSALKDALSLVWEDIDKDITAHPYPPSAYPPSAYPPSAYPPALQPSSQLQPEPQPEEADDPDDEVPYDVDPEDDDPNDPHEGPDDGTGGDMGPQPTFDPRPASRRGLAPTIADLYREFPETRFSPTRHKPGKSLFSLP